MSAELPRHADSTCSARQIRAATPRYTIGRSWSAPSAAADARGAAVRRSASRSARSAAAPSGCRDPLPGRLRLPRHRARTSAGRRRPPAAAGRRARSCRVMRDLNERQSQLFFLIATFLVRVPAARAPGADRRRRGGGGRRAGGDLRNRRARRHLRASAGIGAGRAAGGGAEAGAGRGRPAAAGSSFERDAAVVLRRIEEAVARRADGSIRPTGGRSSICCGASCRRRRTSRPPTKPADRPSLDSAVDGRYTWSCSQSLRQLRSAVCQAVSGS